MRALLTAFFREQFATRLNFPKPPSMWKEGDRDSGGGWRTRWLMRVPYTLAPNSTTHLTSANGAKKPPSMWKEGDRLRWRIENSLTHKNSLHTRTHPCTALPISWICMCVPYVVLSYQSPRPASYHPPQAVPPLSEKEGFGSASHTAFFHEQFTARLHEP